MKSLLILSPFPVLPSSDSQSSALAAYVFQFLTSFKSKDRKKIVVLAQENRVKHVKIWKDVEIHYSWSSRFPIFPITVLREIFKIKPKTVNIQHELFAYGSALNNFSLVIVEAICRLAGINVVITLHSAIPLKIVDKNFIKVNSIKILPVILRLSIVIIFKSLCLFANKVIVHDLQIKKILTDDYKIRAGKIEIIPLFMFKFEGSRKKINETKKSNNFLFFGFLTWYKGLETLVDAANLIKLDKDNINITIAGSIPKRFSGNIIYNDWLQKLRAKSKKNAHLIWNIDYIPAENIRLFFDQAFAVLLPYEFHLSSSGPLTYAVGNSNMILASDTFKGALPDEILFGSSAKDLVNKIKELSSNKMCQKANLKAVKKLQALWRDSIIVGKLLEIYDL